MDTSTWKTKEKCMAAFWLLCAATLVIMVYLESHKTAASTSLQSIGLLALLVSWAMSPKLFLQPLKESMKGPMQKPLIIGLLTFFAFQVASLIAKHMA